MFASRMLAHLGSLLAVLFITASLGIAQTKPAKPTKPTRPVIEQEPGRILDPRAITKLGADSTKWKEAFNELWPLIDTRVPLRDRFDRRYNRMERVLALRGVDTIEARKLVLAALDTSIDKSLAMYAFAQRSFTTSDLQGLTTFLKTPAGKKFFTNARGISDALVLAPEQYVQRLTASVVDPMMKPIQTVRPLKEPADSTSRGGTGGTIGVRPDTTTQPNRAK